MYIHTLLEITDKCQFACPICYSNSAPDRTHRPLAQIEEMLLAIVRDKSPHILKISGGEPTIHPDIERILHTVQSLPFAQIILDTNGLRISQDDEFARRLRDSVPNLHIYLQFDSLRPSVIKDLRGEDITDIRRRALFRLNKLNLATTLTLTVKREVNDDELGEIIAYAKQQPCVRGILLQPVYQFGRLSGFDPALHSTSLDEIRRRLLAEVPGIDPDSSTASEDNSAAIALELKFDDNQLHPIKMQLLSTDGQLIPFRT